MKAGTYTFAVYSPTNDFSDASYTVRFKKIGEYTDDEAFPLMAINEPAGVVFQSNKDHEVCYVNGHLIDISYKYKYQNYSDPRNGQSYDITLQDLPGIKCQIWNEYGEMPQVVYYNGSTKPAKKVEKKLLLSLLYYRRKDNHNLHFYTIQCVCSGAYSGYTLWDDLDYVMVLIDPDDGKLVDISEYNYFYHHVMGSHNISYSNFYGGRMVFNYSYSDYYDSPLVFFF